MARPGLVRLGKARHGEADYFKEDNMNKTKKALLIAALALLVEVDE